MNTFSENVFIIATETGGVNTGGAHKLPTRGRHVPYRRAPPPEANVEEARLRLRLDFHRESVVLHDYAGRVVRTRLVSALDVAHALARELDLSTGLLPPDALGWSRASTGVRIAAWREPRIWTVRSRESDNAKPRRLRLPMPGLVFIAMPGQQAPYVFAAMVRPHFPDDQLFPYPAYNVLDPGQVCPGTHAFPPDPAKFQGRSSRASSRRPPTPLATSPDAIRTTSVKSLLVIASWCPVSETSRSSRRTFRTSSTLASGKAISSGTGEDRPGHSPLPGGPHLQLGRRRNSPASPGSTSNGCSPRWAYRSPVTIWPTTSKTSGQSPRPSGGLKPREGRHERGSSHPPLVARSPRSLSDPVR